MKLFTLLLAFAIYGLSLVHSLALPDSNVKCQMTCDIQEYKPICATDDAGETKTFDNICIMKSENCLRNFSFQKTNDDKCP